MDDNTLSAAAPDWELMWALNVLQTAFSTINTRFAVVDPLKSALKTHSDAVIAAVHPPVDPIKAVMDIHSFQRN